MKERIIRRGEIYMIGKLETEGSEQRGERPVLIVQSDSLNRYSPTTVICFITSQLEKKGEPAHVHLPGIEGLRKQSMVLTEKVREVDKSRLGDYVGRIDPMTMARVERALKFTLDMGRGGKHGRKM